MLRALVLLAIGGLVVASPLGQSARGEEIRTPWLGVVFTPGKLGLKIVEVVPGSGAEDGGLLADDEIIGIDDQRVRSGMELVSALRDRSIGDSVRVALWRDGQKISREAVLSAKLDDGELLSRFLGGRSAPAFELPVVFGGKGSIKLEDHAGKIILIEFLRPRCAACVTTYKTLVELARDEKKNGLLVLGIGTDSAAVLRGFARRERLNFPILRDLKGDARKLYRTTNEPTLIVVDRKGIVRHAGVGGGANLSGAVLAVRRALRDRNGISIE